MKIRTALTAAAAATAVVGLTACTDEGETASSAPGTSAPVEHSTAESDGVTATVKDPSGTELGTVTFTVEGSSATIVTADLEGLEPGLHGFHIHSNPVCEADSAAPDDPEKTGDFLSAGGHFNVGEEHGHDHGSNGGHAGDLPVLLATAEGTAHLEVTTDRFTLEDLTEGEGRSIIVHEKADNHANIPERYAPEGPDEDTLATGDAGSRVGCGVISNQ